MKPPRVLLRGLMPATKGSSLYLLLPPSNMLTHDMQTWETVHHLSHQEQLSWKARGLLLCNPTKRCWHVHCCLDNEWVHGISLSANSPNFLSFMGWCSCNEIQLDGKPKPSNISQSSYQHAQKMHASMTHIFGCTFELGSTPWVKDHQSGHTSGNPSVSEKVATYMVSLCNRKASTTLQAS